ncbi:putative G antigen family E member 3 [Orcinus orca]|uniref:putative G antigen family E member 3 n=1 Tax=Sagmatias obliquidens TaxID=3371155 RepID=UPI000F4447F6|nr:putative G antigen family E member 3 [Lagenorhynchus obliquidens]XP_030707779.1 putative G antigen family E member 3 [Globicephala melas]XP_033266091.1 putative G antigen family E member 3 [Orcinus orca]
MSGHVRRRSKSAGRRESSQVVGPLVAQQPSDKPPQLEEPPSENQDTISAQDIEGPAMEADQQELALLKTVDKPGDGPDVKGEILPSLETIEKPEAGEGQPRI